jgi:hypothetical protein
MRKEDSVKIAIWGSGPAGLLAAHAARINGHRPTIFSLGERSPLYGAQYLHEPILEMPEIPSVELDHQFRGDIDGYRRKVYDEQYVDSVSPEQFNGRQTAYDIRFAYDWLLSEYAPARVGHEIRADALMGLNRQDPWTMTRWSSTYDMVVSTIPRRQLCMNPEHKFNETKIYALGEAPEMGIISPIQCDDNQLICSGSDNDSWYRLSRIFGRTTVEWPGNRSKPPIRGIVPVYKPVSTTCICWPEVLKLGRFGQWKKGVLTHHVFQVMQDLLK